MQFYVMEREVGVPNETWASKVKPVHYGTPMRCPTCASVVTSSEWLPPLRVELTAHGKNLGDVAFDGDELILSARFRTAWENAALCGVEFIPVERVRVRPARLGKKPLTYFYVSPRFFRTHIDLEHSMFEHDEPISCSQCHYGGIIRSIRGMRIDEASWTGEDMFFAWGLCGTIIVTDRVRQLRDEHNLTNINLTPVEKYFWDPYRQWTHIDYSRDEVALPDEDDDQDAPSMN